MTTAMIEGRQTADQVCFVSLGDHSTHVVRREVVEFAMAMEAKLRKKDGKTHWRERPIEALMRLMLLEVEEFKVAHEFFGPDEAMDELRDIANYAMILWDRIRIEKANVATDTK